MENICFFLTFAGQYVNKSNKYITIIFGIFYLFFIFSISDELFQTVDLYEGQDPNSVLMCLAALARKSEKTFGFAYIIKNILKVLIIHKY
jgi:hypothetical protein